jgi:hypothetical protein
MEKQIERSRNKTFNTLMNPIEHHLKNILNLFGNQNTKVHAESFNPDYAVEIVNQQYFSIISRSHGLFWIEGIAGYIEIQNGSKCLRLKKNEVE